MTTRKSIGKDKELGPLSDKAPDGKRGYKSSGRARTTHLKEIKKQGKKLRRNWKKDESLQMNWSLKPIINKWWLYK